ncbi:MAG: transcription termination factor NusA [Verrucomicrobiota bacterium]|nr:transcription termination factor NusA [Verrucomicrobiota bacterium]
MNSELITGLNYLEKEKGIDREVLIEAIESALLSASKKSIGPARELRIDIDRKTGDIKAMAKLIVVERVKNPNGEIALGSAKRINPAAELGQEMDIEVTPADFGRIASQTAKQAMMQRIRQIEKEMIYTEFKDRTGDIVSGTVRRFERSDVLVDLGKFEAVMPQNERVPTEDYNIGDRIRAYVVAVENHSVRGPEIILSRSHPNFVRRLFELEVSEINDKTIEIKAIAREAGFRTKIAVYSKDEKIDPVGACIGIRGARVKNIVRELNNEKIDIIRYSSNTKEFVAEALKPAKFKSIELQEKEKRVLIRVDETQLSLAIGKRGQNARLTSKLVGWQIDIEKEIPLKVSFEQQVAHAVELLSGSLKINTEMAQALVKAGFRGAEDLASAEESDIVENAGLSEEDAKTIRAQALALVQTK